MFVGWLKLQLCISEVHISFSIHCFYKPGPWFILTWFALESALSINKRVVDNFIICLESLRSPLLNVCHSSFGCNKWLLCCYPEYERVPKVVCFTLHYFVCLFVLAHDTTRVKLIYLRYLINVLYNVGQARN